VRNIGVTVAKASSDLMMVVHMLSPDKSRERPVHLQLRRARDQGRAHAGRRRGSIIVFGSRDYSMRVWLDPRACNRSA
jgi:multidrug efflux pump subunit AcrB